MTSIRYPDDLAYSSLCELTLVLVNARWLAPGIERSVAEAQSRQPLVPPGITPLHPVLEPPVVRCFERFEEFQQAASDRLVAGSWADRVLVVLDPEGIAAQALVDTVETLAAADVLVMVLTCSPQLEERFAMWSSVRCCLVSSLSSLGWEVTQLQRALLTH